MIAPVWIGRFHVTGSRDNRYLHGFPAAYLWVASQTAAADALKSRVTASLAPNGLTVVSSDRLEPILDADALSYELRKLIRDARRNPEAVACGTFQGFEDHAGRRPTLLEVKTERLLLRPWEPRDRAPFAALNADREVMNYLPTILTRAESDNSVDQYLADAHKTGFGFLVAEQKARPSNTFVGMMGLRIMPDVLPKVQQPAIELAFRVARPSSARASPSKAAGPHQPRIRKLPAPRGRRRRRTRQHPRPRPACKARHDSSQGPRIQPPAFPPQHLYARHTLYQITNRSARIRDRTRRPDLLSLIRCSLRYSCSTPS